MRKYLVSFYTFSLKQLACIRTGSEAIHSVSLSAVFIADTLYMLAMSHRSLCFGKQQSVQFALFGNSHG
jgi:hypothetical protein